LVNFVFAMRNLLIPTHQWRRLYAPTIKVQLYGGGERKISSTITVFSAKICTSNSHSHIIWGVQHRLKSYLKRTVQCKYLRHYINVVPTSVQFCHRYASALCIWLPCLHVIIHLHYTLNYIVIITIHIAITSG